MRPTDAIGADASFPAMPHGQMVSLSGSGLDWVLLGVV